MRASTIFVWILHVMCVLVAAVIAGLFVLIATSLDPMQIITAGAEPWTNALVGAVAFVGVVIASAVGLRLWYSVRFRVVGLVLLAIEVGGVLWASAAIYGDYV